MKTITCRQMGGMCDTPITANTKEEMLGQGMRHLEEAHPKMAEGVKSMPADDPNMVAWREGFDRTWTETPEE
jgi:predicted small metal-binding protein